MNREIKIRIRDKETKKLIDCYQRCISMCPDTGQLYASGFNVNDYYYKEEWTGLKDKNGVEIWEGDIVKAFSNINIISSPHLTDRDPTFDTKAVEYAKGGFILATKEHHYCGVLGYSGSTMPETLEAIGNIHQHPELLKGSSNEQV